MEGWMTDRDMKGKKWTSGPKNGLEEYLIQLLIFIYSLCDWKQATEMT